MSYRHETEKGRAWRRANERIRQQYPDQKPPEPETPRPTERVRLELLLARLRGDQEWLDAIDDRWEAASTAVGGELEAIRRGTQQRKAARAAEIADVERRLAEAKAAEAQS